MCIDQIADVLKALPTVVIGSVAVYIAWQQWNTNKQKLILDKLDRRMSVYTGVQNLLLLIRDGGNASTEDFTKLNLSVIEAPFLFKPEISIYIDEVRDRASIFFSLKDVCRDNTQIKPADNDHAEIVAERQKEHAWLIAQLQEAKEKFRPYLDVSK